ncbi:MAG: thioredoxin family protein [Candidatus Heimdallarchaeota archaeon]|nr:thioredoxin family protein [Candidatus Heimdallarchaeota archaeon]MCK5047821.1 thioredoxin family protein [Candidatus Heimdallarchaeota archaeon]
MIDINQILANGKTADEYLAGAPDNLKDKWQPYTGPLNKEAMKELNGLMSSFEGSIVAYSAYWCLRDCAVVVPRLKAVVEGLENKPRYTIRGGIKVDRINRKFLGLDELEPLSINKVPIIILFNKEGEEIDRIVEQPKEELEADLVSMLTKYNSN